MAPSYPRPGWGERHPDLVKAIAGAPPIASTLLWWGAEYDLPLKLTGYEGAPAVPDELVSSIRCIVLINRKVVVCSNERDTHPWPGGQRERGESWTQTAAREVLEETGWLLNEVSLRPIGWLHYEYLEVRPADWPFPHPDFVQVVFVGQASEIRMNDAQEWSDTQGWEQSSRLVALTEAPTLVHDEVARAFLRLL